MKKIIFSILILTIFVLNAEIIEEFHTRAEMEELIFSLEAQYPEICDVIEIGQTTPGPDGSTLPIYAVKVSDNVAVDEDEPAVLFVGSVHAEELIGNEVILHDLQTLLSNYSDVNSMEYFWVADTEIWFVPMANPAGVEIVYDLDDSWRKNVRDNDLDGILDYNNGYGNDRDGVDLNRNWDHHWVHGDSLYQTGSSLEQFDYYRGSAGNSESEVQALVNLANEQHFIYSIVWHTSRTGNYSEKLFFPFKYWDIDSRACVDYDISEELGLALASKIRTLDNSTTYEPSPAGGRYGISTPYFYTEWGTYQFTVEASSNRPNAEDLETIIENCSEGELWLLNRVANGIENNSPMLTGHVTDSETGEPLEAFVRVNERHADYLKPRHTDSFGRYWRPLKTGNGEIYSITYTKRGYAPYTKEDVILFSSSWTTKNAQLDPLPEAIIEGEISIPTDAESATIIISDGYTKETLTGTSFSFDTFSSYEIELTVLADGCHPVTQTFTAENGTNNINIDLSASTQIMADTFNNDLSQWNVDGPWELIDELSVEGKAVTDSWGGRGFYVDGCDYKLTYNTELDLSGTENPVLVFDQSIYTEWNFDNFDVEVSTDGTNFESIYRDNGQKEEWKTVLLSLEDYKVANFSFRFRLTDDSPDGRLVDPGVTIDNVMLVDGTSQMTSTDNYVAPVQNVVLNQNYPNPFNPTTKISFNVEGMEVQNPQLNIYNLIGQKIVSRKLSESEISSREIIWKADKQASGIYFYKLRVNNKFTKTKKAILLK